ncbi:MAG: SH3 domain-containing protein [Blastochloris sp.]|nr:SH3 domain-containing protein [Blastochloris sp.]
MRNRIIIAAALALFVSVRAQAQCPGAPYAQRFFTDQGYITTIGDTLNLRAEPNVSSEVLEELPAGMRFTFWIIRPSATRALSGIASRRAGAQAGSQRATAWRTSSRRCTSRPTRAHSAAKVWPFDTAPWLGSV